MTQEQTNAAIVRLMKGKSAEIFASIDPDTGKIQTLFECPNSESAMLMLAQLVERFVENGFSRELIRATVELGLETRK